MSQTLSLVDELFVYYYRQIVPDKIRSMKAYFVMHVYLCHNNRSATRTTLVLESDMTRVI
jgi:hypothetical protein